jgi:hypothetical protein
MISARSFESARPKLGRPKRSRATGAGLATWEQKRTMSVFASVDGLFRYVSAILARGERYGN